MGFYVTAWALFSSIIIIFLRLAVPIHSALQLKNYGVFPVEEGDATMVFYANVSHVGAESEDALAGILDMKKCCLNLVHGTTDCNAMKLISGLGYVFRPSENRTLQMFFASPDLFDREGFCWLRLMSKSAYLPPTEGSGKGSLNEGEWKPGQEFNVSFSTVLPEPNLFRKLMSKMISIGGSTHGYKVCHSDNENANHECDNRDCQIRYGGVRSFFNPKTKECEPTPDCEDSTKHLSPTTRTCVTTANTNIRETYSASMSSTDGPQTSVWSVEKNIPKVVCEHGDRVTGANGHPNCTCHSGWTSLSHEEWEQITSDDSSHPTDQSAMYKMCSVRIISGTGSKILAVPISATKAVIPPAQPHNEWLSKSRTHFWLVVFILIVLMIPCTGILLYIHRSQKKRSKSLIDYENLLESVTNSSSSEDDEEKNASKKLLSEESEDDADITIAEILNRRESGINRTKRNDDNDENPPPPPPSSTRNDDADEFGSSKPSKSVSIADSQKSIFTPTTKSESNLPVIDIVEAVEAGDNERRKFSTETVFSPSISSQSHAVDLRNDNIAIPARRTPSTDELLDLNQNEKYTAHKPMAPVNSQTNLPIVNKVTIETQRKNPFSEKVCEKGTRSSSATEITEQKKDEWAQFIKSLAEEQGFQSTIPKEGIEKSQDRCVHLDENRNRVGIHTSAKPPTGRKGGAADKVQSLPSMSTFSPTHTESNLPKPPPSAIKKSLAEMKPEEFASRQEAYTLLSSLSSPTLRSTSDSSKITTRRPSQHSIWSNVASENAEPPEPETACASLAASMEDVRIKDIYGDLGSDGDSDEALEVLADDGSISKSKAGVIDTDTISNGPRESVAEIFERNRLIYGFPQAKARSIADLTEKRLKSSLSKDLLMESDNTPSDVFPQSTMASTTCSTSTTHLWKAGNSSSDTKLGKSAGNSSVSWVNSIANPSPSRLNCGGGSSESGRFPQTFSRTSGNGGESSPHPPPQTVAAYQIKTSIENALKASRSKSSNSFF